MINTLPLLPSSWAEWDWTQSNGDASVTQMSKGYQALLNQGQCSSFSRLIWNDLVECTAAVISEAGLTWDSTYCSVNECKITTSLGSLTATMFNSVALNIHRFGFFTWKWAVCRDKKGYVGRDTFKGYSEYGGNSDFLYGWYIEELTVKLNRLIQVLKEEANFGEFESFAQASVLSNTVLFSAKVGALKHINRSIAYPQVSLSKAGVLIGTAFIPGYSYQGGILLPAKPVIMQTDEYTLSKIVAKSDGIRTAAISYDTPAETYSNTILSPLVFVGYMKHFAYVQTKTVAPLSISNIKDLITALTEESETLSSLSRALSFPTSAKVKNSSYESVILKYIESLPFRTYAYSESYVVTDPVLLSPSPMKGTFSEHTSLNSVLHRIRPLYIQRSIRDYSYNDSKMNALRCAPTNSVNRSNVLNISEMVAKGIKHFGYMEHEESTNISSLYKLRPIYADSVQKSNSQNDVKLVDVKALPILTTAKSESKTDSYILKGIPRLVDSNEFGTSNGTGLVTISSVRRLSKTLKSYSYDEGKMSHAITSILENKVHSDTTFGGTLSLANGNTKSIVVANTRYLALIENYAEEEIDWLDPIRNNNDLYIRQVYNPWDKNAILYLDSELWYPPIRTGTNLYIRSEGSIDRGNLNG